LPPGLVVGIDHNMPMLEAASQRMADATAGAFTDLTSPAPAFTGAFQASTPGLGAGRGTVNLYGDLVMPVQGVIDPSRPDAWRQVLVQVQQGLRELEMEAYPA
jgi:hypothetical protein